jgi:hypothetical protein
MSIRRLFLFALFVPNKIPRDGRCPGVDHPLPPFRTVANKPAEILTQRRQRN